MTHHINLPPELSFTSDIDETSDAMSSELALILVDARRTLFAISQPAAGLLDVSAEEVRGEPINSVAGGILQALSLRRDATRTITMFELPNGQTLFATTRPLFGSNTPFLGWVIALHQDLTVALREFQTQQGSASSTIHALQQQLKNIQELVAMLPKFSHHPYWQYLLIEHMERLTNQMNRQVQQLALFSTLQNNDKP
jgi:hypothetical protein